MGSSARDARGGDAVSQREVAALVYNYLRANGFVKVRGGRRGFPRVGFSRARSK